MSIRMVRDRSGRHQQAHKGGGPTMTVLVGGLCGLAWAAGLRGFMAQIAGPEPSVDWVGTFGWILVPGIGVGALLGWAEHLRTSGGRRGWRWLALGATALLGHPVQPTTRPVVDLRGRCGRRGDRRLAVRPAGRVRAVGPRATLGADRQRCGGPDRHPDLGADGDLLRRARPRAPNPARRLGRRLLLVVPRGPVARLCHSPSSGHATEHCPPRWLRSMAVTGQAPLIRPGGEAR